MKYKLIWLRVFVSTVCGWIPSMLVAAAHGASQKASQQRDDDKRGGPQWVMGETDESFAVRYQTECRLFGWTRGGEKSAEGPALMARCMADPRIKELNACR